MIINIIGISGILITILLFFIQPICTKNKSNLMVCNDVEKNKDTVIQKYDSQLVTSVENYNFNISASSSSTTTTQL